MSESLPFQSLLEDFRHQSAALLDLYEKPDSYVDFRSVVEGLWEFMPSLLVGIAADWWESEVRFPVASDAIPRVTRDGTPEDMATWFSRDITNGYPEMARRNMKNYFACAMRNEVKLFMETVAELVCKVRERP